MTLIEMALQLLSDSTILGTYDTSENLSSWLIEKDGQKYIITSDVEKGCLTSIHSIN